MSQKTDTVIKLALVFFISLLSFSIGTFVGKKYSDNQHKLASLEPKKTNDETLNTSEFATNRDTEKEKSDKMSDEDVAKIAEEFAQDDSQVVTTHDDEKPIATIENEKDIKEIPASTIASTHHSEEKKSGTPTIKAVASHTEMKKIEERKPSSVDAHASTVKATASASTGNMYTLQVGSFPTEAEAGKLVQTLNDKGFKSSFAQATVNGKTWYRVNVGLFGTVKEAQDYKPSFLEKSKLSSAIVQKAPVTK